MIYCSQGVEPVGTIPEANPVGGQTGNLAWDDQILSVKLVKPLSHSALLMSSVLFYYSQVLAEKLCQWF